MFRSILFGLQTKGSMEPLIFVLIKHFIFKLKPDMMQGSNMI
ncbi:hypothetical protein N748_15115 [Legionella pneumophila str. 121004]|nr:hypothetical protein N748_15115 [Legionella pneumophila str. 121004]ERH43226.1 hypothetical protein N751_01925 [Legionella pneumophila str. Leg01/11]ERH44563.1 hypothetical protein N750_09130 [Legionella pneumophila str. Leg01/53]ERI49235.1 hypothetical protein N749_06010 [Legionella pneumophila str. Leg01/20]